MRPIFAAMTLGVLAVSGCSPRAEDIPVEQSASVSTEDLFLTGQTWSYSAENDKMDDHLTCYAHIRSDNQVFLSSPYDGGQRATLVLRSDTSKVMRHSAVLYLERGQFICDTEDEISYNSCTLNTRLDKLDPLPVTAYQPDDRSSDAVIISDIGAAALLSDLGVARKKLLIQAPMYQDGEQTFEFDVSKFDDKAFEAVCEGKEALSKKSNAAKRPAT